MVEANEISPDVWLFRRGDTGRNFGIALDRPSCLVIDPPDEGESINAAEKFAQENGSEIAALLFTIEPSSGHPAIDMWPSAQLIAPSSGSGSPGVAPADNWQLVALPGNGDNRAAFHSVWERVVFCGPLLSDNAIPDLTSGMQAYLDALQTIEALDAKVIAPRYGTVASGKRQIRQRLTNDRNYAYSLLRHVTTSMAAHIDLDRALSVARSAYEDYAYLDAHLDNVTAAWNELLDES